MYQSVLKRIHESFVFWSFKGSHCSFLGFCLCFVVSPAQVMSLYQDSTCRIPPINCNSVPALYQPLGFLGASSALDWLSVPPNTMVLFSLLLHQRTVLWDTRPPNCPQLPSAHILLLSNTGSPNPHTPVGLAGSSRPTLFLNSFYNACPAIS